MWWQECHFGFHFCSRILHKSPTQSGSPASQIYMKSYTISIINISQGSKNIFPNFELIMVYGIVFHQRFTSEREIKASRNPHVKVNTFWSFHHHLTRFSSFEFILRGFSWGFYKATGWLIFQFPGRASQENDIARWKRNVFNVLRWISNVLS